jgi:hypothetical protein
MKKFFVITLLIWICGPLQAHEFTPTYPKLKPSFVSGVLVAEMKLFNARKDVEYFGLGVYDSEWNSVPFASESDIIRLKYLARKNVNIYIREKDKNRAVYICSESKLLGAGSSLTMVKSKICSKIK